MVVINKNGQILEAWFRFNGPGIEDKGNKYKIDFLIGIPYNEQQKEQYNRMEELKALLKRTDHKPLKYIEGEYSEEEYAPIRAQRAAWRNEIREIEKGFIEPTLTPGEIDQAERKAVEKIKNMIKQETGKEVEEIEGEAG